ELFCSFFNFCENPVVCTFMQILQIHIQAALKDSLVIIASLTKSVNLFSSFFLFLFYKRTAARRADFHLQSAAAAGVEFSCPASPIGQGKVLPCQMSKNLFSCQVLYRIFYGLHRNQVNLRNIPHIFHTDGREDDGGKSPLPGFQNSLFCHAHSLYLSAQPHLSDLHHLPV